MSKRDDLIEKYADDLKTKCNLSPDMDLLKAVTIACGPSIYNKDASTVSSGDKTELDRLKLNFLIKKLSLKDTDMLDKGINSVVEIYGKSNRNKYRAVMYYLLTKHFKKESIFK